MRYDAILIGGGLAGCTAAVSLACRSFRVLLLEQKRYPRHKLCGEFLSGEAAGALTRLGVLDELSEAGARRIDRALLVDCRGGSFACDLPAPALGISRYRLDPILWRRSMECGADCRDGVTVRSVQGDLKTGFQVETSAGGFEARVVISAHGKRARLDQSLSGRRATWTSPYVAFKGHFHGARMGNSIEMYGFPGGYCGISPVEDGLANICWIAHEKALAEAGGSVQGMLQSALTKNSILAERLETMRPAGKFTGVSRVALGARGTFAGDICLIGDAAGMIAPLCGDGMAMALRSAEIASGAAGDFLAGRCDTARYRRRYTRDWNREFALRLSIGRFAHSAGISPLVAHISLGMLRAAPWLGRWLVKKTRG